MVVHAALRGAEEDEEEPDRKWNLRQIPEELPLRESDERHDWLVEEADGSDQHGGGLGSDRNPPHDVHVAFIVVSLRKLGVLLRFREDNIINALKTDRNKP